MTCAKCKHEADFSEVSNTGSEVEGFAEVEWMWQCTSWLSHGRLGLVALDFR